MVEIKFVLNRFPADERRSQLFNKLLSAVKEADAFRPEQPLVRVSGRMKAAMTRSTAHFIGTGAGPISLVMISFGVDPMTGRATAMAAGHGFLMGWVFAIAGDMLYYAVIAVTTLHLNKYFQYPNTTMWIVLGAMMVVPLIVRAFRAPRKIQVRPEV